MEPYQERVLAERAELAGRLEKLQAFMNAPAFWLKLDDGERARLRRQRLHMEGYLIVLDERIAAFEVPA